MELKDNKQGEENTELVKDVHDPKPNYLFQKTGITKTGFFIIVLILALIIIGIIFSGLFFDSPSKNP